MLIHRAGVWALPSACWRDTIAVRDDRSRDKLLYAVRGLSRAQKSYARSYLQTRLCEVPLVRVSSIGVASHGLATGLARVR